MRDRYDLVVLGGGTGGLVSALIAAGAGASVALVERARPGGDCLWTGCVPSKSLLAAAELAHRMRRADAVGLGVVEPRVDFAAVMERVDRARATIEPQDSADRLRRDGVDVIEGDGRFEDRGALSVDGRILRFRKAIIATGAEPTQPPIPGLEAIPALTSENLWELRTLPQRLMVLGGGPIGCELAQGFARLGSAVTQVEMAPRLLLKEEPRASELVAEHLRNDGVTVCVDTRALSVKGGDGGSGHLAVRHGDEDRTIDFDRLLVATGRTPRTEGLNLEGVGVRTDQRGAVIVNGRLRTTARHIYAVGDVTAALPFTHVAAYHARIAVVNALFAGRRSVRYDAVPWVTFTDPEVGRVGMTEQEARDRWGDRVVTTSFEYSELDRAITAGVPYGFAKLVGHGKGRLVGATVAAVGGGEAIAELSAWISTRARIDRVSQNVHAYPTFAEGPARAADQYLRTKLARPRMQALTKAVLRVLRALDSAS
ncbi:MAG TPA: FAD-dependent oxidoreductase [Solirubrobacteraceae bacterium]|nr:FAD-dependent oxidoreductase [Solirubrobacteraceae bacterium]